MTIYNPLLEDAIEMHCHSSPSLFPRKQNDWELLEDARKAKMHGIIIKSHESQTYDRATLLNLKQKDVKVVGGLVLNHFTGGLSPFTVDAAIQSGAQIIWMPTFSSKQHQNYFEERKTNLFKNSNMLSQQGYGIEILDKNDKLKIHVHEILELIASSNAILSTGHLSVKEVCILVREAKLHGVNKILIQHADLGIARIPFEIQKDLVHQGAIIEKCYLACSSDFNNLTVAEMAENIKTLGAEACVMVTDYGQAHHIPVIEAFSKFIDKMLVNGITENDIRTMIHTNPLNLLN